MSMLLAVLKLLILRLALSNLLLLVVLSIRLLTTAVMFGTRHNEKRNRTQYCAIRFGSSWLRTRLVALVACAFALQSCGVLRNAVFRYSADCDYLPYYDTRVVIDIYPKGTP